MPLAAKWQMHKRVRDFARRHDLGGTLLLCLPAALVAVAFRAYLLAHYPSAFIHNDSASVLETADTLVSRGVFHVEGKNTPLLPAIYCIPALLGLPILPFAAVVQHLLGPALVFIIGFLCRAWLIAWKVWIVPVTLLIALHPVIIFYEHLALAETYALFFTTLVALLAWLFYRQPRPATFVIFLVGLLLVAVARPEGNLFVFFGVALVIRTFWGRWKRGFLYLGLTLAWSILVFVLTPTSQSGLLLHASVVHLSPSSLALSPGLAEALRPIADASAKNWREPEVPNLTKTRKSLQEAIIRFQVTRGVDPARAEDLAEPLAKRAALEIVMRNALNIPSLALRKFVLGHHEPLTLGFNEFAVDGQLDMLFEQGEPLRGILYAPLAWGREIHDRQEASEFFASTNHAIAFDWIQKYREVWSAAALLPLLPLRLPGAEPDSIPIQGIPWLYAFAALGLISLAIRPPQPFNFHFVFGLFLVGFFVAIMVTANVRARFRFVFEPFWILYATAFLDSMVVSLRQVLTRFATRNGSNQMSAGWNSDS